MTKHLSDDEFVRLFQLRAKYHGLFDGQIGGNAGPLTLAALNTILPQPDLPISEEPWITVGKEAMGKHEKRDNEWLRKWLKRDGRTLGDPASLPWCGDFLETCMRVALPNEELPGPLGENPYWARNWLHFGMRLEDPMLHAVVVFERGNAGHAGFLVGEDDTHFYVFGGNQSDSVNISRIAKARALGFRFPKTWAHPPRPLPRMSPGAIPETVNEF